jgi:hypothetical protein
MNIRISLIVEANGIEWDSIWQACDYSTYFHSLEWATIWDKYTDGRIHPEPLLITFSDGLRALLPFSSQKILKGFAKQIITSPADTYGGWISRDELTVEHGQLLADYMCKKFSSLLWRFNPYDEIVSKLNCTDFNKDETDVLDLERGFDSIYHSWTKGHKSASRKARREGIIIQRADRKEDWVTYYRIYEHTLKRWGDEVGFRYTWKFFETIYGMLSKNIVLWVAKFEDKIVAGALCFYSKNHVVYWHGAALSDYFNMRPVNLLMHEIIEDACKRNYRWFDFNPSGGHEGVKAFKESFRTKKLPCPVIMNESKLCHLLRKARTMKMRQGT